ncbi:MAG: DUF167 domain-containing protein [Burkholderiales bacterium]|jgi:uncharacterized protein|nr:DUF167 domain-containing protein [Burkholderiales bacterium]
MECDWSCLRRERDAVVFDVSVVPGAKRTELVGLHDGALRVRLAAPPVDGKANDALIVWLANELGVTRRCVKLLRGASSRRKQVRVEVSMLIARAWLTRSLPPSDS